MCDTTKKSVALAKREVQKSKEISFHWERLWQICLEEKEKGKKKANSRKKEFYHKPSLSVLMSLSMEIYLKFIQVRFLKNNIQRVSRI